MSGNIEAAFKVLSSTNGEPDEKITLRGLLLKRLKLLNNQSKDLISIDDLLTTHDMFLTSSFKPFISTSSIYLKTLLPQINLGNYITIELDQCFTGDFIHDMYLDVTFNSIGQKDTINEYNTVISENIINESNIVTPLLNSTKYPKFRYTPYPGIRLIEKVELWLNGRKVDEYTQEDMLFYMNNELANEKRKAFEKCVGQSDYKTSFCYSNDTEHEDIRYVADGYQTFKTYQEELHMRIPLLFWFNKYIEKSYPVLKQDNVIISNSRNHIKITFADIDKLIQCGDYNETVNPIINDSTMVTPFFNTNTLKQRNIPYPDIKMSLFVNNIYVNDEIRSFYINNIDHYMVSTYQSLKFNVKMLNEIKIKDLHDMVSYLYFAFRTKQTQESFTEWFRFTQGSRRWHPVAVYIYFPSQNQQNKPINGFIQTVKRSYYDTYSPIIKKFTLNFDTLPYIKHENPSDYNKYLSQLKKDDYSYSYDEGIYLLPFCRKFNDENPSGHINFSRISEIILKWEIDQRLKNEDITLFVSAKRINLLSINETDVIMKWSSFLL